MMATLAREVIVVLAEKVELPATASVEQSCLLPGAPKERRGGQVDEVWA